MKVPHKCFILSGSFFPQTLVMRKSCCEEFPIIVWLWTIPRVYDKHIWILRELFFKVAESNQCCWTQCYPEAKLQYTSWCRLKLFFFASFCSIFTCGNMNLSPFEGQHCFLRPSVTLSHSGTGLQDVFISGLWRTFVDSWLLQVCVCAHNFFMCYEFCLW